ncbi:hypothetical protein SAMN05192529_10289 [Arachidicoccus rhizosphaerae]|uniref:Uncharacterized protein n=1 Tax=Arachidicoccus rhizosphaerae TaxID=551991 RepID=A0A1H3W2U5_9BACT|nr:hypothetical protein SAMN05192529_10289 [Arachidicoccus rhizosphaerae]
MLCYNFKTIAESLIFQFIQETGKAIKLKSILNGGLFIGSIEDTLKKKNQRVIKGMNRYATLNEREVINLVSAKD